MLAALLGQEYKHPMGRTLTRANLSEAVYQEVGLSRNESADFVERVLEEISSSLEQGETVKVSSFGAFAVREKGGRVGRNPKTGEEVPIKPRRVLVFRPSHVLKDRVNKSAPRDEGVTSAASDTSGSDSA
ncbi:hypothetical protein GCM10011587_14740 [Pyruvatibacter mobilis]|nr:hypothetical protein GCM10011587_14740 [Pyruvatibacter mobilis]